MADWGGSSDGFQANYGYNQSSSDNVGIYLQILLLRQRLRTLWKLHKRQSNKIRWLLWNLRESDDA